jgi:hypothetical protein
MTWQPQNPKDALSRRDQLTHGVDAVRHPFLGNVIPNYAEPKQAARDFLGSLLQSGQVTAQEYTHLTRKLVAWEAAGGTVERPHRAVSIDHPLDHLERK